MTVAELIEKLKALDPTMEVKFSDYEQGHSEFDAATVTNGWESFELYQRNRPNRTRAQFDALPVYVLLS